MLTVRVPASGPINIPPLSPSQMPRTPNSPMAWKSPTGHTAGDLYNHCRHYGPDLFGMVLSADWVASDVKATIVDRWLNDPAMESDTAAHVAIARVVYHANNCSMLWDALMRSDRVALGPRTFVLVRKTGPAFDMVDLVFPRPEEIFGMDTVLHTMMYLRHIGTFTAPLQERIRHMAVKIGLDTYQRELFDWGANERIPIEYLENAVKIGWI